MPETNVSPSLDPYFKDYESYHRTKGNKICHFIGIPTITTSLLGILSHIVFWRSGWGPIRIDGGVILLAGASAWYFQLDRKIALPFGLFGLGVYYLGRAIPWPWLWMIFFGGWVVQYIGHLYFERNRPAFYKNILHFLIGPLWIFSMVVGYYRPNKQGT